MTLQHDQVVQVQTLFVSPENSKLKLDSELFEVSIVVGRGGRDRSLLNDSSGAPAPLQASQQQPEGEGSWSKGFRCLGIKRLRKVVTRAYWQPTMSVIELLACLTLKQCPSKVLS